MPSELRILRFDLDEVANALRSLGPRIGLDVPAGAFTSAIAGSGTEAENTCFILGTCMESCVVSNGQLAASLIHYCGTVGIPIPRGGRKEIHVTQEFAELRIGQSKINLASGADASG